MKSMNVRRNFLKSFWGIFVMCASAVTHSDGLLIGHTSVQSVFADDGVVKLIKAAIRQDPDEAKRLLASGVDVNAVGLQGYTPLLWVSAAHDFKAMKLLLDLGANPDKATVFAPGERGMGPASWMAAGGGQLEMLRMFLDHGSNPNLVFGIKSLLVMAVQEEHMDCAELLLQRGADINYDQDGTNAFFEALTHVQFGNALWVLNHGFTHDLQTARRMANRKQPRSGQENLKIQVLEIIDQRLAEQKR